MDQICLSESIKTFWFAMTSNDDSLRNCCFSTEASAMPVPAANSLRAKKHQETNPTLLYITWAQWASQKVFPSSRRFCLCETEFSVKKVMGLPQFSSIFGGISHGFPMKTIQLLEDSGRHRAIGGASGTSPGAGHPSGHPGPCRGARRNAGNYIDL